MKLLTKIFGTKNDKIIKKEIMPLVNKINALEPEFEKLTDDQIREKTAEFRKRFEGGESLDSLLPEAYANCREGAKRALGMRHYDVQMIGGVVLHQGKIAEMKTGEGKTLTATLPCYLHGLSGLGAHVVTVNDYLAKRDAEWMGQVYNFLGLSVGSIISGLSDTERQAAYNCDITYGTNNEFGFDYLRDNMKQDPERIAQRSHHFAIVDEVDSILIDEARTPLIISGPADTNTELYGVVNSTIPGLQKDSDYTMDEKSRSVSLTEDGISKLEKRLRLDNLYDPKNIEWLHHVQQALKAHVLFKKDVDYVVRGNDVIIVDEFTGRLMPGRRYSDGLHGALEAKEHVPVQQETQTLATITFQNLFRMYEVLSGMTGTADTEAVEFNKIYKLDVVVVPTNKPIARDDQEDMIYRTSREKYQAIAEEIQKAQQANQPVLVGTVSVEKSELLSSLLDKLKVPHEVLNAKNHAREAQIVESAGELGRVTIATNMAGRGTDIKLGQEALDAGGLYVIGTERHESRRIDNQLRGRSGRQGDPGKSRFFLSLEDDLMRIFASDKLSSLMKTMGMEEGEPIISPMVSRAIERAQRRVEEQNFSSRKHLLEYDDVMNQQRQVVYTRRKAALLGESSVEFLEEATKSILHGEIDSLAPEAKNSNKWDIKEVKEKIAAVLDIQIDFSEANPEETDANILTEIALEQVMKAYKTKMSDADEDILKRISNYVYLQVIDHSWKSHLQAMDALKDSVRLRGYGQRDPLQEYKKEAFNLFSLMMGKIEEETTMNLLRMPKPTLVEEPPPAREPENLEFKHPEAGPAAVEPESQREASAEDGMIYHGSRSIMEERQTKAGAAASSQTFKREGEKVGRNDPCPCGSGKKYKKCHGRLA